MTSPAPELAERLRAVLEETDVFFNAYIEEKLAELVDAVEDALAQTPEE